MAWGYELVRSFIDAVEFATDVNNGAFDQRWTASGRGQIEWVETIVSDFASLMQEAHMNSGKA